MEWADMETVTNYVKDLAIDKELCIPTIVQYGGRRRIRTFDPYFIRVVL